MTEIEHISVCTSFEKLLLKTKFTKITVYMSTKVYIIFVYIIFVPIIQLLLFHSPPHCTEHGTSLTLSIYMSLM